MQSIMYLFIPNNERMECHTTYNWSTLINHSVIDAILFQYFRGKQMHENMKSTADKEFVLSTVSCFYVRQATIVPYK
jgi:hypothetical protein